MNRDSMMLRASKPFATSSEQKRVLLIDTSRDKRDLRSETMRNLGLEVDCAADISEARCWWKPDLYNLVVIHVEDAPGALEKFCNDLRTATPPQKIMFLAGEPAIASEENSNTPSREKETMLNASHAKEGDSQPWGIQDACRRISAIRSRCDARTRAIRNRPEPPPDSETLRPRPSHEITIEAASREELQ